MIKDAFRSSFFSKLNRCKRCPACSGKCTERCNQSDDWKRNPHARQSQIPVTLHVSDVDSIDDIIQNVDQLCQKPSAAPMKESACPMEPFPIFRRFSFNRFFPIWIYEYFTIANALKKSFVSHMSFELMYNVNSY